MKHFATLKRFLRDSSGVALIEFAFVAPMVLGVGMMGSELAQMQLVKMRLSQIALSTADTLSRVGLESGLALVQLTEADVNDAIIGAKLASRGFLLTTNGRIVISGLQTNFTGGQWISWQRCKGIKNVGSAYGVQNTGLTGTSFPGMGPVPGRVMAAPSAPVVYVEIFYDYQPLFPFMWSNAPTGSPFSGGIANVANKSFTTSPGSLMVRDNREQGVVNGSGTITTPPIRNPANPLTGQTATPSLCTTYSA